MAGFSRISVQKRKIDRSVARRNCWFEYQGKTVAQQERSQSVLKDVNYKRNDGKGSSVPRKKDEDAAEGGRKASGVFQKGQLLHRRREKAWKESRGTEVEDERKRCVAFEDAAKRMLECQEDSEDLKVGLSELKEQLETPEGTCFLSCRLPNRQEMREAKSSSRSSGKKRIRCTSPVRRGGMHN